MTKVSNLLVFAAFLGSGIYLLTHDHPGAGTFCLVMLFFTTVIYT